MDPIGQAAVQSLAIDVANLTTRLAIAQATVNQILTIGNNLTPSTWKREPIYGDAAEVPTGYSLTLPVEEANTMQELLMVLAAIQSDV